MAKIPSWDETTEIPSWDDTQPIEAPKAEKAAGTTMMDALFPRRAQATKDNAGPVRQFAARAADVGSNLLGVPYAAVETLAGPKEKRSTLLGGEGSFKENLMDREGGTIVKRIANDPATVPTAMITGPGGTLRQLATTGLKQGAASAAAHQAENVGEGRDIEPGQAALEALLGASLPVAAQKGGQALKATGKGFMQSIIKPSKFLRETEKIDMGDLIENLGSMRPFKGSVAGMAKKAGGLTDDLGKQYDDVVKANAGTQIDVPDAIQGTKQKFNDAFVNEKKLGDVIDGIDRGGEYWADINQRQGATPYNLPEAVNFRKSVGRMGRYNENKDPRDLEGLAQFSRSLYGDLSEKEAAAVPALVPLKNQLSTLYPLQEAVENAQGRTANNFYPGLTDNIALASAAQASKPEMSIPALALFLANRIAKNPAAATTMYKGGKALEAPGAGQEAMRAAVKRALGQSFREEED